MVHPDMRPTSFTYPSMASMWAVTHHNRFLYSDPPLTCHPSSYWLMLFPSKTFSRINTPTFSSFIPVRLRRWRTECTEASAYKIQMPGNYPEESIQHKNAHCMLYTKGYKYKLRTCNRPTY